MLDAASTGEVTAFVWCAIGQAFSLWYGRTKMTREDRMNLLGQLHMLARELEDVELETWK